LLLIPLSFVRSRRLLTVTAPSLSEAAAPVRQLPGPPARTDDRPEVAGKFFRRGGEKLYLRGITYGPFRPGDDGVPYRRAAAEQDFARIAAEGINTVRLYTAPPAWILDTAADHGLLVMAGLAWEQHVAFLEDGRRAAAIVDRVARQAEACAGHPALLAWAVGNEIPAPTARWHGASRMRRFVSRLHDSVKRVDPGALVTYVNYPSTEYLDLDFLDFLCFNVFLEDPDRYEAYLHRLQNIADERPLVLAEIGLDSGTHGEDEQAIAMDWQVRRAFAAGCAGAFVFSWTDEWHRGGHDIEDWHFGVTDRERRPKPALAAVRRAFEDVPTLHAPAPPRVSVVICTHNGARYLEETCAAVTRLDYPDVEVIVVDDGSTDASADIARAHGFKVISTANRGLSAARNTGMEAATGQIVAYIDDDAAPDPHWLLYLVDTFEATGCGAAGGPNLPVPGDGAAADAVAVAPGNPTHVLVADREAEHVPGCNFAFRAEVLRAIGGFDPRFRVAGDDVDACWRVVDRGHRIAYSAGAMVWHHRRSSVGGYLRQQRGYGRAEAMLERKWPERYSAGGHVSWQGRLYGPHALPHPTGPLRWRVYHGVWGTAPFQSLYEPARGRFDTVLLMPEVYLGIGLVTLLVALGAAWPPLFLLAPVLVVAAVALSIRAVSAAAKARFPTPGLDVRGRFLRRSITAFLHVAQPLVRLEGRLRHGLTPWRRRGDGGRVVPVTRRFEHWRETWLDPSEWVRRFESALVAEGAVVRRGGDFDGWDLEVRGGTLAGTRVSVLVEEHGGGRQLGRVRCRPVWSLWAPAFALVVTALCVAAAAGGATVAALVLGLMAAALGGRTVSEAASAMAVTVRTVGAQGPPKSEAGERPG
jgi:GT2 family glycosyltransferase